MIEKIKKAISEVKDIEKEAEERTIEVINRFDDLGIIGLNEGSVQFYKVSELEEFTGTKAEVIEREDVFYDKEAVVFIEGLKFFALLDDEKQEEYKNSRCSNND